MKKAEKKKAREEGLAVPAVPDVSEERKVTRTGSGEKLKGSPLARTATRTPPATLAQPLKAVELTSNEFYYETDLAAEQYGPDAQQVINGRLYRRYQFGPGEKAPVELLLQVFCDRWYTPKTLAQIEQVTGLHPPRGPYTQEEHAQGQVLVEQHCADHGLTQHEFRDLFMGRSAMGKAKARLTGFLTDAARHFRGRPLCSVFRFFRRMLHPEHRLGRWTPDECAALLRLHAQHGPRWDAIALQLGRSNITCRDRFRMEDAREARGPWSPAETARLVELVAQFRLEHAHVFTDSRGTPVTRYPRYIRWGWVQERLGRRSALRCSQKWCELKARLRTTGSLGEAIKALACTWTDHDNRVLLRHLYDLGYVSRAEIVWDDVIASLRAASHPALQLSNHHVAAPGLSEPELQLRFQRLCAHCMRGSLASLFALFHVPTRA